MKQIATLVFLFFATSMSPCSALAISPDEFQALTIPEKRSLVAGAFERRLKHAENFSYQSTVLIRNFHFDDGQLGKPVSPGVKRDYVHWLLQDDYRMDATRYRRLTHDIVAFVSRSSWDAENRRGQYLSFDPGNNKRPPQARIDSERNPTITENRYRYWLHGEPVPDADFLFPYLLSHRDDFQFAHVEGSHVELKVPWIPFGDRSEKGYRTLWLDMDKDFMPVRGEASYTDQYSWRSESFQVEASQRVGDVWMPTKMREIIRNPITEELGQAVVWDTTASNLLQGKVTAADLKLELPAGTHVADTFQGTAYYTDAAGKPVSKPVRLVDAAEIGN